MKSIITHIAKSLIVATLCLITITSCKDDYEIVVPTLDLQSESIYMSDYSEQQSITFSCTSAERVHVNNIPEGWKVEANFQRRTITVTAPDADNEDAVDKGTATIIVISSTAQSASKNLYMSIETPIDLSSERSNCYVISQADCSYLINTGYRGESEEKLSATKVELLWQSPGELITSIRSHGEEHTSFHVNSNDDGELIPGNALLVARDQNDEIIWSWHLWITSSKPEAKGRYMDRNLGSAYAEPKSKSSEILSNYGTYYQWGRPTPFIGPASYNCASSKDAYLYPSNSSKILYIDYVESTPQTGNMEYALANPLSYILGNEESDYDWHFGHDDKLWSKDSKTLYDPCPKGWRVADNFNELKIASPLNDLESLEAQYGFMLTDGEWESFFMGAGRRSWLNGLITNVNQSTTPSPWIGYYWSGESKDYNESRAMYFELDTDNVADSELYQSMASARANGMQLRCVREE